MDLGKVTNYFQREVLDYFGAEFLSIEDIDNMVVDLANKIDDKGFKPDAVTGILRGGYYPAKKLAEVINVPYFSIDVSRDRKYLLGVELTDMIVIPKIMRSLDGEPKINKPFDNVSDVERMLIVDEDCGSGKTYDLSENEIKRNNPQINEIKRAALFVYPGKYHSDFFAEEMKPLNKFISGSKRFPWKSYSPYFKDYVSLKGQQIQRRKPQELVFS